MSNAGVSIYVKYNNFLFFWLFRKIFTLRKPWKRMHSFIEVLKIINWIPGSALKGILILRALNSGVSTYKLESNHTHQPPFHFISWMERINLPRAIKFEGAGCPLPLALASVQTTRKRNSLHAVKMRTAINLWFTYRTGPDPVNWLLICEWYNVNDDKQRVMRP